MHHREQNSSQATNPSRHILSNSKKQRQLLLVLPRGSHTLRLRLPLILETIMQKLITSKAK